MVLVVVFLTAIFIGGILSWYSVSTAGISDPNLRPH
jgi:hypothetical protein